VGSKKARTEEIGSPFADWAVRDRDGNLTMVRTAVMERDKCGGYTFADSRGAIADFPPGAVVSVLRHDAGDFEGTIIIEWPQPANGVLPGWALKIWDADSGRQIFSASEITATVDAAADGIVVARLVLFADPDGNPVYGSEGQTQIHLDDDKNILTGVFRFRVAEMRVADPGQ
jgi:hypothetical protein